MRIDKLNKDVAAALGVKNWVIFIFTVNSVSLFLLLFIFLVRGDTHRETLVPPKIYSTFWVDDGAVSKEYLVQMGVFLAQLYFDVTPTNVDFNHKTLQKYISPRFYGSFESLSMEFSARIKSENASTAFSISDVFPDEKNNRIAIRGMLNTYLGTTRTSSIAKTYIFQFSFNGGRVLLSEMTETHNEVNPYDLPKKLKERK